MQPPPSDWRATLRLLAIEHAPLLLLVLAHLGLGYGLQAALGAPIMEIAVSYEVVNLFVILFAVLFFSGHALTSLPKVPEGQSAFRFIWTDLRTRWLTPRRLGGYLVVHLALPFFMSAFQCIKIAIPRFVPFSWDERFHRWDLAIHGGHMPWELLGPLSGDGATLLLNVAYNLWFFILFGLVVWQGLSEDRVLRFRFLASFLLVFILGGNVLALLWSSVGPCFWGMAVPGPDPYAPLMARLHGINDALVAQNGAEGVHLWSLDVQAQLWEVYATGAVETVGGISAMPSMHVASSVLFACLGWAHSRWLGVLLTAFAAVIQVGSVALGWHYAVDGYVGACITLVIWFGVKLAVEKTGFGRLLTGGLGPRPLSERGAGARVPE